MRMTLPCADSAFLFEAVQAGVGLADDRGDLVLGFENYAFRLIRHYAAIGMLLMYCPNPNCRMPRKYAPCWRS